jgi:hypothetical protein
MRKPNNNSARSRLIRKMKRLPIAARPYRIFLARFPCNVSNSRNLRVIVRDGMYSAASGLIQLRPALEASATSFVAEG